MGEEFAIYHCEAAAVKEVSSHHGNLDVLAQLADKHSEHSPWKGFFCEN